MARAKEASWDPGVVTEMAKERVTATVLETALVLACRLAACMAALG
jgi:hypothetical protein